MLDGDQKLNETVVAEVAEASSANVTLESSTESSTTASTATAEGESNNTTTRNKREDKTVVVISRGCKRLDFIDGFAIAQRSGSDANATERVYAQLCSSDLCNSGDGRKLHENHSSCIILLLMIGLAFAGLKCYECSGTGVDHPCMKSPTTVAKAVTCEWNEVCFVERFISAQDNSTNATTNAVNVKRGCRRSSLTVDEEGKIMTR